MEEIITLKENIKTVNSAKEIFYKIKRIKIDYSQENFLVFYLNTKNVIIKTEILFKGGLNSVVADPKTIFRKALLKNSNAIIVAHNHPSGDLTPSYEDQKFFNVLKEFGDLIKLKVLDSVIFNKKEFYTIN